MQAPAKKPLTLIGGSVRAAALSAVRGGFDVHAIDRFGDTDLQTLCQAWLPLTDPPQLAGQLARFPAAPVLLLGGCERFGRAALDGAPQGPLYGASPRQFRRSQCPATLRRVARLASVGFPPTRRNSPPTGSTARWLIKHGASGGGLGVRYWDGRWPLRADEYLQQRIGGRSLGAGFLTTPQHTRLLGVCGALPCGRPGSPSFAYRGSFGPLPITTAVSRQLQRLGQTAAELLGLKGLFNADLIQTPSAALYLLEINPRYSASMELLESRLVRPQRSLTTQQPTATLIAAHVAAHLGQADLAEETAVCLPPPGVARCKRIVYAPHDLYFAPLAAAQVAADGPPIVCDLPAAGALIRRGQPAFTCLAEAATLRQAARTTRQMAAAVLRRCPPAPG